MSKKITQLPAGTPPYTAGVKFEAVQAGINVQVDASDLPGGGGAVSSVFGRTGTVSAATSDYEAGQIDNTPAGNIVATNVQAAINELDTDKRATLTSFRRLTTDHTLDATDLANVNAGLAVNIEMNVGSANTVTIPPNSSQAFATGTKIIITQYGAGQTSLLAGSGVTINPSAGAGVLTIPSRYTSVVIEKVGTDEWYLKNGPVSPSAPVWQDWGASLAATGFSSVSVAKSFYTTDGKTVHVWVEISGTSNATTFTFSLPVAASSNYSSVSIVYAATVQNNGTTQTGRIVLPGSNTSVTVDATIAGGAFTGSGTKALRMGLIYQI